MGIFDFENLSTEDIELLVDLSQASYFPNVLPGVPGEAPPGWETLVADDLDFEGGPILGQFQGNYFVTGILSLNSAAARVLVREDTGNPDNTILTVSFQGTDRLIETLLYPEIGGSTLYLLNFAALLESVADYAEENDIETIWITGHSLGAAAVNELNELSDTAFGGAFADATYVSFASPEFFPGGDDDILNIGYSNDPVFKSVDAGDFETATENILLYNLAYLYEQGEIVSDPNSFAELLLDLLQTHNIPNYIDGIGRIIDSEFYDEMDRDSFVIVDAFEGTVSALEGTKFFGQPTYFIGSEDGDRIIGGDADDSLEGFGGSDSLLGGEGSDAILGGEDADVIRGQDGDDSLEGDAGDDDIFGGDGDDILKGESGDDFMSGGSGEDEYVVDFSMPFGTDTIAFDGTADTLVLQNSGLTEQDVEDAIDRGFGSVTLDFGADGVIELMGFGVNFTFDIGDVVLA